MPTANHTLPSDDFAAETKGALPGCAPSKYIENSKRQYGRPDFSHQLRSSAGRDPHHSTLRIEPKISSVVSNECIDTVAGKAVPGR